MSCFEGVQEAADLFRRGRRFFRRGISAPSAPFFEGEEKGERDRDRLREVQGREVGRGLDPKPRVACAELFRRQAAALRAEHERDAAAASERTGDFFEGE